MQKILIYGVGNPFRCDDSVGLKVAEELKKCIKRTDVHVKSGSIDGLAMLDEIMEYDKIIFIDSIKTKKGKPGDIYKIKLDPLKKTLSLSASHGIDFVNALRLGKKLGYKMPRNIDIYAIEIENNISFSENCTDKVKASISKVVKNIINDINREKGINRCASSLEIEL